MPGFRPAGIPINIHFPLACWEVQKYYDTREVKQHESFQSDLLSKNMLAIAPSKNGEQWTVHGLFFEVHFRYWFIEYIHF